MTRNETNLWKKGRRGLGRKGVVQVREAVFTKRTQSLGAPALRLGVSAVQQPETRNPNLETPLENLPNEPKSKPECPNPEPPSEGGYGLV
jgi:hypothetical protein